MGTMSKRLGHLCPIWRRNRKPASCNGHPTLGVSPCLLRHSVHTKKSVLKEKQHGYITSFGFKV